MKPGEKREVIVEGLFPRRGVYRDAGRGPAVALSARPLPQVPEARRLASEIVVYPLPERSGVPDVPPEEAAGGRTHAPRRGGGSDIRMLRDFLPGDDPRDLHWKQSARMRRWIVREREAERDRVVVLALENAMPDPTSPTALEDFERRVSRCAAQASLLLSRGGDIGFQARGVKVAAHGGRPSARGSWMPWPASRPSRSKGRRRFPRCGAETCAGS